MRAPCFVLIMFRGPCATRSIFVPLGDLFDCIDRDMLDCLGYILTSNDEATRHMRAAATRAVIHEVPQRALLADYAALLFRHGLRMLADRDPEFAEAAQILCTHLWVRALFVQHSAPCL